MTTPLSTDRIVLSKWWGAYRVVPALAILPAICCLVIVAAALDQPPALRPNQALPAPLDWVDQIACVGLPVATLLAQGAWLSASAWPWQSGIAGSAAPSPSACTICGFFAFGWLILAEIAEPIAAQFGFWQTGDRAAHEFVILILGTPNPLIGQMSTFETLSWPASQSRLAFYLGQVIILLAMIAIALVVLALSMATFNRCVGRASERPPQSAPRPPRRLTHIASAAAFVQVRLSASGGSR